MRRVRCARAAAAALSRDVYGKWIYDVTGPESLTSDDVETLRQRGVQVFFVHIPGEPEVDQTSRDRFIVESVRARFNREQAVWLDVAIGLAVMTELPLVIVDVQRGGPSTGLPTKTEQADLLQALYGRNGESPVPVIAGSSPSDCFEAVIEAARIAVKYMTPVFFLSDGYIANGQEPWLIPEVEKLTPFPVKFRTDPDGFFVYQRQQETLARAWVRPGTPGERQRWHGAPDDGRWVLQTSLRIPAGKPAKLAFAA